MITHQKQLNPIAMHKINSTNTNQKNKNQSAKQKQKNKSKTKQKRNVKYDKGEAEKNSLKSSFKKRVKETLNQEEDDDEESHLTYELDINDQREISNNPCILENDSTANNENDLTENRTEFNNQLTSEMCQRGEVVNAGKETKNKTDN